MSSQVVVWNVDARNRPELEVELELVEPAAAIPGFYLARFLAELEVELVIVADVFDGHDTWFLADDDIVALDDYTVYDAAPRGYADAYAMAI